MKPILVIQLGRMGDLVQTLPLFSRLADEYPQSEVRLLCWEPFADILRGAPRAGRLLFFPQTLAGETLGQPGPDFGPRALAALPALNEPYSLALNLSNLPGAIHLFPHIRAERKAGRRCSTIGGVHVLGDWGKYLLAAAMARRDNLFCLPDIHQGMAGLPPVPVRRYLPVSPASAQEAEDLLRRAGWRGGDLVCLQPGASEIGKRWPASRFAAVARDLAERDGTQTLLVGGPGEADLAESVAAGLGGSVLNLVGKTPTVLLPALLSRCRLFLGNDSGPIHVAAAVGTPCIGLYFSTVYFGETAPYGEGNLAIQADSECCPCYSSNDCRTFACQDLILAETVRGTCRHVLDGTPLPTPEDASIYRSRFLAGGSMVYEPVPGARPSRHFLEGFLLRTAWEGALGIPPDRPFQERSFANLRQHPDLPKAHADLVQALQTLQTLYRQAESLSNRITAALTASPPMPEEAITASKELVEIEKTISSLPHLPDSFLAFHEFQFVDMEAQTYPDLAFESTARYAELADLAGRSCQALFKAGGGNG